MLNGVGFHKRLILAVCLFGLLTAGCSTAPDLETSRKFQQAEELFNAAASPEDYIRAAAVYQEILDSGFDSGSVYYNQGNAWMQAGKTGRAIAAYRQAKRHLPRDPYLDANLNQALSWQTKTSKKPILDYVFFWQHSISYLEKSVLVTVLLSLLLALCLLRYSHWQPQLLRTLCFGSFALLILTAISLGRDWYNFDYIRHGVVVAEETIARKGGSENYDPAFNQPLRDGTEFVVLQERNDWLNIRIEDSGEGWVPGRDCVTYP